MADFGEHHYRAKALVIEDAARIRELWREFLGVVDCEADEAADGSEGLLRLKDAAYDLLVTDVMMRGVSGWDVAREARRRDGTVAILLLGWSAAGLDLEILQQPGVAFLQKPVHLRHFRAAVEQCLGAREGLARAASQANA